MTTNQQRALETMIAARYAKWPVEELPEGHDERTVKAHQGLVKEYHDLTVEEYTALSQALSDAGLLAPDLPEPEMDIDRLIWRVDEEGFVYRKPDGRISTIGVGNPYPSMEIARRHALAVLAATSHYAAQEKK